MTSNKGFKKRVRDRMEPTDESPYRLSYSTARRQILAEDECEAFNKRVPEGTEVRYWPGEKGDKEHEYTGKTRSHAWPVGGHTAVVLVTGYTGGIALTHVEVIDGK
jgi:hypothetical protein